MRIGGVEVCVAVGFLVELAIVTALTWAHWRRKKT